MNLLYIHIPKTGGSTISHALMCRRFAHEPITRTDIPDRVCFKHTFYDKIPYAARDRFTVASIRNPYDRAVSSWAFTNPDLSFVESLRKQQEAGLRKITFIPQHEWIDGVPVDFLIHFENMHDDILFVREEVQTPVARIGHFNRSGHRPYQEHYDDEPEAIDLVRELYKEDFRRFGYPT